MTNNPLFRIKILFSILSLTLITSVNSQNMYNLSDWNVGTGNITDFNQYGATTSNARELGYNHIGEDVVLWKATPNPSSNAEGGIYASYKTIDNTKTYRLSVWVMKTNSDEGKTYFGCHSVAGGAHHTLNLDGSINGNPYFWSGDLPELNRWYLMVSYVHSNTYSGPYLGRIYDGVTGEPIITTSDKKFDTSATNLRLRAFLFNDPNLDDRQYLYEPIMELIDGTEFSIEQLLSLNPGSKLIFAYDNAGNQKQRFYCPTSSCIVPNPPVGRVVEEDIAKTEEEKDEDVTQNIRVDYSNKFKVYPNPTKDVVNIQIDSEIINSIESIKIYSSNSSLIQDLGFKDTSKVSVDLTGKPSGVYFVHVHFNDGSESLTKKVIKE